MDWRRAPAQVAFAAEVEDFIKREWGPERQEAYWRDDDWDSYQELRRRLAARGWTTQAWPREYGGADADIYTQVTYNEVLGYNRVPQWDDQVSVGYVGPSIILYGSDEQRRRYLPAIAAAGVVWCVGFSEPNAGSDLAAVQTTAVRDGDAYIVNGTKIWTSYAHKADYCLLVVRTDPDAPKHKGISLLLVDMRTPGITISPLHDISGRHHFNQIFFDNVRVPLTGLLGVKNRGWYQLAVTLDFERSAISGVAALQRSFDDLCGQLRCHPRALTASLRLQAADLHIALQTGTLLSYRVADMQAHGRIPNAEASMAKVFNSELRQRLTNFAMKVAGLSGQADHCEPKAAHDYLGSVSITIAGGTSEVQRNIIATRGLGLPR
jgi:alkylation response protein AidB-like acyl-CoA dehydrogenase